MKLEIIVASEVNSGIGISNGLPWPHNKADMQWFVAKTTGKTVIMGSNTWDSLPKKPLPNRTNLVVSRRDRNLGVTTVTPDSQGSVVGALRGILGDSEAVVIGGAQIYKLLWPEVSTLHWSKFKNEYDCDTFLPIQEMMDTDSRTWILEYENDTPEVTFQTWRIK